jgi:hypothetical protein
MNVLHRSRSPLYEAAGRWWRFSEYEVNAESIRPKRGARLQSYDPWERYEAMKQARGRREPPYLTLIELARRIDEHCKERMRRDPIQAREGRVAMYTDDERAAVAAWCAQWGLLGLLPHFAKRIVLAPRWERFSLVEEIDQDSGTAMLQLARRSTGDLIQTQRSYQRVGVAWQESSSVRLGTSQSAPDGTRDGDLAQSVDWPGPSAEIDFSPTYVSPPGESRVGPLYIRWSQFFPVVPWHEVETYSYPRPLSEAFWHAYSEPMFEFYHHAQLLRRIWDTLPFGGASASDDAREQCRADLHALVSEIGHVLENDGHGSFRRLRVAPSLLGALALMMFEDLAEPRRVRRCAQRQCQVPFRAGPWANRYCSARCRKAATQSQFRRTQRAAIAATLRLAGLSRLRAARLARSLERKYQSLKRVREAATDDDAALQRAIARALPRFSARGVQQTIRGLRSAGVAGTANTRRAPRRRTRAVRQTPSRA